MTEERGLLELPVPEGEGLYRQWKRSVGLDDPDLRRNVLFVVRWLVEGPLRMERVFRLGARAADLADLGSGSGWVSLEIARRNPRIRIRAVDRQAGLQDWARSHYDRLRGLGVIRHEVADLETLDLGHRSLDAALALFSLGCLRDPLGLLERVHAALRPGGLFVYADGVEPPPRNLDRLAAVFGRERLLAAYRCDAVRRNRPPEAPPEDEVHARLRERFEVLHESRTRAFVDLYTGRYRAREALWRLPLLKAADEAAMAAGLLEGAVRFVIARKPS